MPQLVRETPPALPELFRGAVGQFLQPRLKPALLWRVRQRIEFAFGNHPSRRWRAKRRPLGRVCLRQLALKNPVIVLSSQRFGPTGV
jgi:hypothetical protein